MGRADLETFLLTPDDPPARRAILVEGLRLFAAHGLDGVSVRDIAEATGFTNPALYRHFSGKGELAHFLFERCYAELERNVDAALNDACDDPEARLDAFVAGFLGVLERAPEALVFVNDNLSALWPKQRGRRSKRTLVSRTRELLKECCPELECDALEIRSAAVLGTINQVARMVFLGGLARPVRRWQAPVRDAVRRLAVA